MNLLELFNSVQDKKVLAATDTSYKSSAKIGEELIGFDAEYDGKSWSINFGQLYPSGKLKFGLTNSDNAPKVLGFIKQCMLDFIKHAKPKQIEFKAYGKRVHVYKHMLDRFAADHGYTVESDDLIKDSIREYNGVKFTLTKT
jgi:hypothetical protein